MLNAPTVLRSGAELVWFARGGDTSKCLLLRCVTPWCAAVRRPKGPDDRHQGQSGRGPRAGMRPAPLSEVLPQVGVQRHTVEQRIVHTPFVQILDALVPQMVEQLVDFFKDFDVEVPAQVIKVPKIPQDIIPQRSVDLVPQMVEQLVEVPTIVSYSSLQRSVEHRVDIPVPGRGGRSSGL